MRTTITIDDQVSEELLRFTGAKSLAEAVRMGLENYVRRQKLAGVVAMRGKFKFRDDWDYKALRRADRG